MAGCLGPQPRTPGTTFPRDHNMDRGRFKNIISVADTLHLIPKHNQSINKSIYQYLSQ